MAIGRTAAWVGAFVGATLLLLLFWVDPQASDIYPSCPFRATTGLLCPGCGSLRATHDLLHLRIGEAFAHNALLVIALPVLGLAWLHTRRSSRGISLWHSNLAVWTSLVLIVAWAVFRNLPLAGCCGI